MNDHVIDSRRASSAGVIKRVAKGSLIFARHPLFSIILIAVPVLAWTWSWDWFRPIIEAQASAAIGHAVHMVHFDVDHFFSRTPLLVFDGITIDNPSDFPDGGQVATIDRLSVRIDAMAALGQLRRRHRSAGDRDRASPRQSAARPRRRSQLDFRVVGLYRAGNPPRIGSLIISDGQTHVVDPKLKSDFWISIHTDEQANAREPRVVARAHGTYAGAPVTAEFVGDSLLMLRDTVKPYPVDFHAANGATHIAVKGTIKDPMQLAGANLELDLAGNDLADLYHVLGVPLAPSAPYHLTGRLDYADGKVRFRNFAGTVGTSDLEGDFVVEPGHERPRITADLTSKRIVLADLAGFIGGAPGQADSPNQSQRQRTEHAQQAANPKLIPDTPINLPEVRAADFKVHYRAQHIDSQATPLDNLEANLTIENGDVTLRPLSFGIGTGVISTDIALHSQRAVSFTPKRRRTSAACRPSPSYHGNDQDFRRALARSSTVAAKSTASAIRFPKCSATGQRRSSAFHVRRRHQRAPG